MMRAFFAPPLPISSGMARPGHRRTCPGTKLIAFRDRHRRPLKGPGGEVAEFHPNSASSQLVLDDGLSLKCATLAGAGISLNSLWSIHAELASGDLVHVLPGFEGAESHVLWLVYPKTNVLSPKVRAFMDFLIDRLGTNPLWNR